jgi:Cu2+-exporting ATPase
MAIDYQVKHAIPGRMRLRVPDIARIADFGETLTRFLAHQPGIKAVRINAACQAVIINYQAATLTADDIKKLFQKESIRSLLANYSTSRNGHKKDGAQKIKNNNGAPPQEKNSLHPMTLPTASLALSVIGGPLGAAISLPLIAYNAAPTFKRAFNVVINEQRLNVDFLDSLAITISTLQGSYFTSALMNWLISLGDNIRDRTGAKSKRAIEDLLDYQGKKVWVLRGKKKKEIAVSEVKPGDIIVVYPGSLIPVDGVIIKGQASVDQKTMTGESLPVERAIGNKVYAATVVADGKLYIRAERIGNDTTAAQIVRLVESAPVGETRIQNYAEQFADRLVTPSLSFAAGLYLISGDLNRFLSMVIIDYGTGIRVAAPTTVLAAMTHAARQGIIIKSGSHLEKLTKIDTIIFDKTGTLTKGIPKIVEIVSYDEKRFPTEKILALAAAAEARHKHPVAQAILDKARETQLTVPERTDSHYFIGLGVEAQVNGYHINFGSERFLQDKKIRFEKALTNLRSSNNRGLSTLLLAVDGELAGMISYADQIRAESQLVIQALQARGKNNIVMLTGDNSAVADAVARQLGINRFFSEVFPAEKAEIVQSFQKEGRIVAMVGDGINDSPALSYADVGIAMKNGADVAREAADVILMEENLWKIVNAIDISNDAIKLIYQNYGIIAGLNTLAFALALPSGLVSPALTTTISNGSAILASINAIRPILRY